MSNHDEEEEVFFFPFFLWSNPIQKKTNSKAKTLVKRDKIQYKIIPKIIIFRHIVLTLVVD